MKTIGIIGGMSWESSIEYYRIINECTRKKMGGLHSSKSVMVSVDFAPIEEMQKNLHWEDMTRVMIGSAKQVESGGADFIIIATNTMHKMFDAVQRAISIPVLHIADATAYRIKGLNLRSVGLLGTIFTMEMDFYKNRLIENFDIEVITPEKNDRDKISDIIYQELVLGEIKSESKTEYIRVMDDLIGKGAEGIILGCTEIPLLVDADDTSVPVFDTTQIHAETAVEIALSEKDLLTIS
jgi:aspartate racemase